MEPSCCCATELQPLSKNGLTLYQKFFVIAGETRNAEQASVLVQEPPKCPEAVLVCPAVSALPRIFCSVANAPSSSYQHQPQVAPAVAISSAPAANPTSPARRSKRMAASQPEVLLEQPSGPQSQVESADPREQSPAVQQPPAFAAAAAAAETANRNTIERSQSRSTADPDVVVECNQSASYSVVTSGTSSQLTIRREQSVNLVSDNGLLPQPAHGDTSLDLGSGQSSPLSMQAVIFPDTCLQPEPETHADMYMHQFKYQQGELCQAGSGSFDSQALCLPAELMGPQLQYYTGSAVGTSLHQQAAWDSVTPPDAQQAGRESMGVLFSQGKDASNSLCQQFPKAPLSWPVSLGQHSSAVQDMPAHDRQFSKLPVLHQSSSPHVDWEQQTQQAWHDAYQQQPPQQQQQQQHMIVADQWAEGSQCLDHQLSSVQSQGTVMHRKRPFLGEIQECEASWWMMPHCDVMNMFP